jgi:hypothetical protein
MKVLFHTTGLNFRGTTVAVMDYARYNQEILGNESVISYCADSVFGNDGGNEQSMIDKIGSEFELRSAYNNNFEAIGSGIDVCYFLTSGYQVPENPILSNARNCAHVIFQFKQPYADRYAYVSEWLSNHMSGGELPYVPHIVHLPEHNADYRKKLGIGTDKIIIGRHGGLKTMDIRFTWEAVMNIVNTDPRFVFVFLNTQKIIEHPNIIYLDAINDPQEKSNYINMCDAFIQGKSGGESFGLAPCESLFFNKPTFCFNGGTDLHHVDLLRNTGLLYNNTQELVDKLQHLSLFTANYNQIVDKFNPKTVMEKFDQVFLK